MSVDTKLLSTLTSPPSNMRQPNPKAYPMRKPSTHPPPQLHPQHPPPHNPIPQHQPPFLPPPPHHHRAPKQRRRTALASCIVATIFLIFIIIVLCIGYYTLFKPKDPKITITSIQLPTFSVSTNSTTVISFTFSQYAAVNNPNRGTFSHFDSTLQLLYGGNQVGFMFIPAAQISSGRTEYMDATFTVGAFPITTSNFNFPEAAAAAAAMMGPPITDGIERVRPTLELESRMEMVGRIRVLWFFSHHLQSLADCRVQVSITDGSLLGYHC